MLDPDILQRIAALSLKTHPNKWINDQETLTCVGSGIAIRIGHIAYLLVNAIQIFMCSLHSFMTLNDCRDASDTP